MLTQHDFTSPEAYRQYQQESTLMIDTIQDLVARINPCLVADPNDDIEYDDDCNPIVK